VSSPRAHAYDSPADQPLAVSPRAHALDCPSDYPDSLPAAAQAAAMELVHGSIAVATTTARWLAKETAIRDRFHPTPHFQTALWQRAMPPSGGVIRTAVAAEHQ
jgi:hypothetical protein